jgi:hypothetical protein
MRKLPLSPLGRVCGCRPRPPRRPEAFEVINRLLAERPDVEGITLPGMPPGSPGMPGEKSGKWKIYAFKNGRVWLYAVS